MTGRTGGIGEGEDDDGGGGGGRGGEGGEEGQRGGGRVGMRCGWWTRRKCAVVWSVEALPHQVEHLLHPRAAVVHDAWMTWRRR